MIEMRETRPLNVLFLSASNSVRSIIAEAILSREGMGRFKAYSAGLLPKGSVHPYALDLLSKLNYQVDRFQSKSWINFVGPDAVALDFVFTVCDEAAQANCAGWPGRPMTAHWAVPDPAVANGNDAEIRLAFADAFRMLNNRILIFTSLPIRSLDQLALQRQLDLIARTKQASRSAAAAA